MLPDTWAEMQSAPAFLITMDYERQRLCHQRISRAGYTHIHVSHGVNRDDRAELEAHWSKHPFPAHREIFGAHPAAVLLAHMNVWRNILENQIPYCTIFEDDTLFHTQWNELAPLYYQNTPKTADMIYMGHHCGNAYPEMHIAQTPVYCLNAYMVTYDGISKMYNMITQYPIDTHFGVIDMMLANLQSMILTHHYNPYAYSWYAWNTQMFPDPDNESYKHPDALEKDKGLVFQQWPCIEINNELSR